MAVWYVSTGSTYFPCCFVSLKLDLKLRIFCSLWLTWTVNCEIHYVSVIATMLFRCTRAIQKVSRLIQLGRRYSGHILQLFNLVLWSEMCLVQHFSKGWIHCWKKKIYFCFSTSNLPCRLQEAFNKFVVWYR